MWPFSEALKDEQDLVRERGWATPVVSHGVEMERNRHVFGPGRSIAGRPEGGKWQKSTVDCIIGTESEYGGCGKSQENPAIASE